MLFTVANPELLDIDALQLSTTSAPDSLKQEL